MKLVSVIIPVYNVENYLERCINSVINQTYHNLEIILVNDGSKDSSGAICDKYQKKDARIKVIHKENGGLSDARNVGIAMALGEYITFIDSDDFVLFDYIEFMVESLQKNEADISTCGFVKFEDGTEPHLIHKENQELVFSGHDALVDLCYQKHFANSAWGKLYKTKLFNEVRYPAGMLYEDLGTTYHLFLKSTKIVYNSKPGYFYLQRNSSIMHYDFSTRNLDRIRVSEQLFSDVKNISKELEKAALSRLFISNIQVLRELPLKDYKYLQDLNTIKHNLKSYRKKVLLDNNAKVLTRIIAGVTYLPISLLQRMGALYKMFYH